MKLSWCISGKFDMESTCGRFKILDRIICGTQGYDGGSRVGKIQSRRIFVLDKKQGKTHVLLPTEDPTSFARKILREEGA